MTTYLKENVEIFDKAYQEYENRRKIKEKDLFDFEIKHNLRPNREVQNNSNTQSKNEEHKKTTGLVV